MVSALESRLKREVKEIADLEADLVARRSRALALQKAVGEKTCRAVKVRKHIADLEAILVTRRSRARALEKAVEAQKRRAVEARKRREMRKLVQKVRKPKGMCIVCFYGAVGRPVGSGHTHERGSCLLGPQ